MKKILTTLFLLCMISAVMSAICSAAIYTPYEAGLWGKAQCDNSITFGDGRTVSFIRAYIEALGEVPPATDDANEYTTCALPEGWTRTQKGEGDEPQTGDILIFTGYTSGGWLGIYYKNSAKYYDAGMYAQGFWGDAGPAYDYQGYTHKSKDLQNYESFYDYWGYIRPDFAGIRAKNITISDIKSDSYQVTVELKNPLDIDNDDLMMKWNLKDSAGNMLSNGIGGNFKVVNVREDGWTLQWTDEFASLYKLTKGESYRYTLIPQYGGHSYPALEKTFTVGENTSGSSDPVSPAADEPVVQYKASAVAGDLLYQTVRTSRGNTAKVIEIDNTRKRSVVIPATVKISGVTYKVTEIDARAFYRNKKLTSLTIGKNVKKIGKEAFYGCIKLKTIKVKSRGISSIGPRAFKNIYKKAKIYLPKKKKTPYKKMFTRAGAKKASYIAK